MQTHGRITLAAGLCLVCPVLLAQTDAEPPPVLRASEVLPESLLEGPHHRVNEEVRSDGYLNYYTIESDFGPFEAQSNLVLAVRVREFEALAELQRVSKSEVFASAAIEAGLSPARAVVSFAKRPVSTVIGIPAGIGRMFKRYARAGKEGIDSAGEFVAASPCEELQDDAERSDCEEQEEKRQHAKTLYERYFKISDAERRWHEQLGTDPYTSNEVLHEAVKSVAWADRLGRFSIGFAGIPSIPGADYVAEASKIVWSKDPYELRDYNVNVLRQAGLDEDTIEAFFANPWFSPTMQTTLIAAMASLPAIAGRQYVLLAAINTDSEAEARFVLQSIIAMTWYHAERSPINEFADDIRFPVASTEEGHLLVILPVDYLVWTEEMAGLARAAATQHQGATDSGARRELWLFGGVSSRARREIEKLGWTVLDQQRAVIRASVANTE